MLQHQQLLKPDSNTSRKPFQVKEELEKNEKEVLPEAGFEPGTSRVQALEPTTRPQVLLDVRANRCQYKRTECRISGRKTLGGCCSQTIRRMAIKKSYVWFQTTPFQMV